MPNGAPRRSVKRPRIVVAGGGPVGLTFAACLLESAVGADVDLRVIEAGPAADWSAAQVDVRVYALSRASQRILTDLDLWPSILARRASPYRRMRVWEGVEPGGVASLEFDCADIGEPDLGSIVEDNLLRAVLADALPSRASVVMTTETSLATVDATSQPVALTLAGGERLEADLLVAADGAASRVRELLAIPVAQHDYRQRAVVTHIASERPHAETALQRFLPGGPLAFLPLADGRSSIVWSLPTTEAQMLEGAGEDAFIAALQTASGDVLGRLRLGGEQRAAFPLRVLHALHYCRPGVALIGDAAHSVHPLAGQGMNLGLLDAACLAAEVERALERGDGCGDLTVLRRYERRRKAENLEMLVALDALSRVFRMPAWTAPGRALGMAAINRTPAAKHFLMRRALGLQHRIG
jgi:2-polyprenylphenol 6-hydroxylase